MVTSIRHFSASDFHHCLFLFRSIKESMFRKRRHGDSLRILFCSKCLDRTTVVDTVPVSNRESLRIINDKTSASHWFFMISFHQSELVVIVQRAFDKIHCRCIAKFVGTCWARSNFFSSYEIRLNHLFIDDVFGE